MDGARAVGGERGTVVSAEARPAQIPDWEPEPAGPLMGARAFAVVMGGPLVLLAAAVASAAPFIHPPA